MVRQWTMLSACSGEVYGQAVATLVRVFGDITLAEDAVQDAFVAAMRPLADAMASRPTRPGGS